MQETREEREIWIPNPGPQTDALLSEADHLFYGGAAGGGKTDLLLGCALRQHTRSIIFRREFKQLQGLRERAEEIWGDIGRWNGQKELWRIVYQRQPKRIEFGAVQLVGHENKYQGRAHDLKGFDEITHFAESQFRFLIGWNRSANPLQRSRVICTGNPPTDAQGDWVISYWGPWLDAKHPNPAKPGELRWFATINGKDFELPDNRKFVLIDGERVYEFNPDDYAPTEIISPHSRTFIRARVQDNPYYVASGYIGVLQALPEPLRSQMLLGDFAAGHEDDPYQVIPTDWVLRAQSRWTPEAPGPMDAIGADIARGGKDKTVLSPRHGNWLAEQVAIPGQQTPDGWAVLQQIIELVPPEGSPTLNIDIIGVGGSVFDLAAANGFRAFGMNGSERSAARDASGRLGFVNKRAEWWWKAREALDPLTGDDIALPPDRELLADLTAPRWEMRVNGIKIEDKEEIIKRIGRSPDRGDSAVLALAVPSAGPRTVLI